MKDEQEQSFIEFRNTSADEPRRTSLPLVEYLISDINCYLKTLFLFESNAYIICSTQEGRASSRPHV